MTIVYLNVTKKDLTETQKDAGCVDFASREKEELRILLSSLDSKKNNRSERDVVVTKIVEMVRGEVDNLYQEGKETRGVYGVYAMMKVSEETYELFWELMKAGIKVVPKFKKTPITINLLNEDNETALYLHFENEEKRRPCYIYLDLELGSVCMATDSRPFLQEPEEHVTMKRTLKWEVPLMTACYANVMMVGFTQQFQTILDGSKIERPIGSANSVAIFNSNAEKAILKIREAISKSDGDVEEVCINKNSFILCNVDGKASDFMLEELAKTLNMRWWENSNTVLWGTLRALKEKRKESWYKLSWREKEFTDEEILLFIRHPEWDDTDDKNLDRLYRIAAETAVKEFVGVGVWDNFLHDDDFVDIYEEFLKRTVVTNKEVLEQCRRILWGRWMDAEVVVKIVKDVETNHDAEELGKAIYELHVKGDGQACEDFLFLLKKKKIYLNRKRAKGIILLEKQLEEKRKGVGLPKIDITIRDIEGSYRSEALLLQV